MSSFIRRFRSVAALGACAWFVSAAVVAQEAKTQRPPDRPDPRTGPVPTERAPIQTASSSDAILASCLIIDNQGEIALAQLAQQRAENPAVKAFAQQLVQDHTEAIKKLQQFAGTHLGASQPGQAGRTPGERGDAAPPRDAPEARRDPTVNPVPPTPTTPRSTTSEPPATTRQPQPTTQPPLGAPGRDTPRDPSIAGVRPSGTGLDLVALKRELGEKCLQTARRELEGKSGAEFDKCYIHMAVWGHLHAIDTMEVFQSRVSPQFRQVIAEGIQMSQKHLKTAQELAKKLEGNGGATETRTSTSTTGKAATRN
jgi:predicted outer membrane protein